MLQQMIFKLCSYTTVSRMKGEGLRSKGQHIVQIVYLANTLQWQTLHLIRNLNLTQL